MSESEHLVYAFMDAKSVKEELDIVNKLILLVARESAGFVSVLEHLQPWFAGDKPDQEITKSMKLIGELLAKVKTLNLTFKQKEILLDFFLRRLRKLVFVDSASKCFEILYCNYLMSSDTESADLGFKKLIELLEGEYWLTSAYVQPIRHRIYNCLHTLLKQHIELVQGKEMVFVKMVLDHTNEERDPRNLFVILNIWQQVLFNFDKDKMKMFADSIFDTLSIYFPIIFKNKSSTSAITVDDLNIALNRCLSHELLVDQFVTLIFSKMSEDEEDVRTAALSGLIYILEVS